MLSIVHPSEDPTEKAAPARNARGQGHLLRAQLIASASELLASGHTESELSLRRVARQAGVAATSVYLHFADREELLWGVTEAGFEALVRVLDEATLPEDDSPTALLRARAMAFCRYGLENPGQFRLLFCAERVDKEPRPLAGLPGAQVFAQLEEAVSRGLQPTGNVASRSFLITTLLWASLHGIVSLRLDKPQFPWPNLDELVDESLILHLGTRSA